MQRLRRTWCLISTVGVLLALTGCGGGGGSSPGDTEGNTPQEDDSNGSQGPVVIEPTPDTSDPLEKLLGRVYLQYKWDSSSNLFELDPFFSEIEQRDSGNRVTYLFSGTRGRISCFHEDGDVYYCVRTTEEFYQLFRFGLSSTARGFGAFEHCANTVETSDCVNKLRTDSDGTVTVTFASARTSAQEKPAIPFNMELITTDVMMLEKEDERASASNIMQRGMPESALSKRIDALRQH